MEKDNEKNLKSAVSTSEDDLVDAEGVKIYIPKRLRSMKEESHSQSEKSQDEDDVKVYQKKSTSKFPIRNLNTGKVVVDIKELENFCIKII